MGNSEQYFLLSVATQVSTWKQTSTDLFAYNSWDMAISEFRLTDKASICFSETGCFVAKDGETEADSEGSCLILRRPGTLHTDSFVLRSSDEIWLPIKYLSPSPQLLLVPGMEIRFGRARYVVQEIGTNPLTPPDTPTDDQSASQSFENICRICLSGFATPVNPLLTLCKCTGSLQLIHLECAKAFLLCKIRTNDNPVVDSFHIKPVVCDLCHAEFPLVHSEQGREYRLQSIFRPEGTFVKVVNVGDPYEFHFLHPMEGRNVRVGRGRNNDWNVPDTSVSRFHASVSKTSLGFTLQNEESKFGTLVKAGNEVTLPFGEERVIQVKKSVLSLKAKRPCKLTRCCSKWCGKEVKSEEVRTSVGLSTDNKFLSEPSTRKHEDLPLDGHFQFL